MAWIESHQEIASHPKTKRLARLLNVTIPTAIGHLHLLWWWALSYAPDGNLSRFDNSDIADACLWSGEPEALISGMSGAGYLDVDLLRIHDWQVYAGRLIALRARNAKRQRKHRAKNVTRDVRVTSRTCHSDEDGTSQVRNCDVRVMSEPHVRDVPRNLTGPNLTEPDRTGQNQPDSIPVADAPSSATAAATPTGEVPSAPKARKPRAKRDATPEIISLIELFRSEYLQNVDANYQGFKGDYPQSEIDSASYMLRHHGAVIEDVIRWVVRDKHPPRGPRNWIGWHDVIRSLANIQDKWPTIEQRARQEGVRGLSQTPAAPTHPLKHPDRDPWIGHDRDTWYIERRETDPDLKPGRVLRAPPKDFDEATRRYLEWHSPKVKVDGMSLYEEAENDWMLARMAERKAQRERGES